MQNDEVNVMEEMSQAEEASFIYLMSEKTIPYSLCEAIVKEVDEKRSNGNPVRIHRKICKECGKTFLYWEEIFMKEGKREVHDEKFTCDKCGGALEHKKIWAGKML